MVAESTREGTVFALCIRDHMERVVVLRHRDVENSEEEDKEL